MVLPLAIMMSPATVVLCHGLQSDSFRVLYLCLFLHAMTVCWPMLFTGRNLVKSSQVKCIVLGTNMGQQTVIA